MYPSLLSFPGDLFAEFDSLQRQMDRLLGPRGNTSSIRAVERGFPAINIGNTADAVEVYAFAPGIEPAKLELTVDKGLLTIAGERRTETGDGSSQANVYARERVEGTFRRVIALPEDADPERVDASYRDGVLRIRVQRREASRPRRIEVSGTAA